MFDQTFEEISRVVERKQAQAAVRMGDEGGELADGWIAFGGVGSFVNKACALGLRREVTGAELDELARFFESRGVEPKVELSPFAHPSVVNGLAERGFALREFENVLAASLSPDRLASLRARPVSPEIRIQRVDPSDEALVLEYIRVAGSGFVPEGEQMPESFITASVRALNAPGNDGYVARVGDELAGAGGCESGDGVTALFGTTVKPQFRKRGIQQALIAARLLRGAELGSTLGVIISRPGIPTERNASRLGFEMAYTRAILTRRGPGLVASP